MHKLFALLPNTKTENITKKYPHTFFNFTFFVPEFNATWEHFWRGTFAAQNMPK